MLNKIILSMVLENLSTLRFLKAVAQFMSVSAVDLYRKEAVKRE